MSAAVTLLQVGQSNVPARYQVGTAVCDVSGGIYYAEHLWLSALFSEVTGKTFCRALGQRMSLVPPAS